MRKKKMSEKEKAESKAIKLTPTQRMIYYTLVGNPKYKLTQKNASHVLGIPLSTVNDAINKHLVPSWAIYKNPTERRNILYRKGTNAHIVDRYVENDIKNGLYGPNSKDPVVYGRDDCRIDLDLLRAHLNGGWIDVLVIKEGRIDGFFINDEWNPLFEGKAPTNNNQLMMWNNKIPYQGIGTSIRYQKGVKTGKMVFGIAPTHVKITSSDLKEQRDQIIEIFYERVTPLLQILEKYGGWVFDKQSSRQYNFRSNAIVEYGFSRSITDSLIHIETSRGIPGVDPLYYDESDPAGKGGEFETQNPDMAVALNDLPKTTEAVSRQAVEIKSLSQRVDNLENKMKDKEESP